MDLRRNGQLNMDPPYQRKSVWNSKDQRFFLDTVFRGYPSPPIFLHKTMGENEQTVYAVVDGKQRLQTLFLFADNALQLPDDFGDSRFNSRTWGELETDEKQILWDYVVPVEFLTFTEDDLQTVGQAFDRLNRNMRKLEPQELRHARWDGWFISLVENQAENEELWRTLGVSTNARSKRMKDAQFISELLLLIITGEIQGFDQQQLDDTYSQYDDVDDPQCSLNTDDVVSALESVKQFLREVQEFNGCIRRHSTSFAAFYTLWAVVSLHREALDEAEQFAEKYNTFMELVKQLRQSDDPNALISAQSEGYFNDPLDYLEGSRGASTDLSPRTRRLNALCRYLGVNREDT